MISQIVRKINYNSNNNTNSQNSKHYLLSLCDVSYCLFMYVSYQRIPFFPSHKGHKKNNHKQKVKQEVSFFLPLVIQ